MGGVIYRIGDIFKAMRQGEHRVMGHGCNCMNTMGAGIAPLVAAECPGAESADKLTKKGDTEKLGTLTYGIKQYPGLDHESYFMNLYTQYDYSRNRSMYTGRAVSYDAVEMCALSVRSRLNSTPSLRDVDHPFCIPLIGAGLGGGDWSIIVKLFSKHIDNMTVYVLPNDRDLKIAFGEDFRQLVFPYFTNGGKWMLARFSYENVPVTMGGATYLTAKDAQEAARSVGLVKEGMVVCSWES